MLNVNLRKESSLFGKAQLSAFVGGIVDYLTMLLYAEIFNVHYSLAIVAGGIVGAIVNFRINKKWTFQDESSDGTSQLLKFMLVVIGSIFLKSSGTVLLSESTALDYKYARIIIDAIVCFGFNYTLQRRWVFGKSA